MISKFFLFLSPKGVINRLANYSLNKVKIYGAPYIAFGIFCCLNYTFPYVFWGHKVITNTDKFLVYIKILGIVMSFFLLINEKWNTNLKRYLPLYWYLNVGYCLPFTFSVMLFATNGQADLPISITATILLVFMLVDPVAATTIIIASFLLGYFVCFAFLGISRVDLGNYNNVYILVFKTLLSFILGFLFTKYRQRSRLKYDFDIKHSVLHRENIVESYLEVVQSKARIIKLFNNSGVMNIDKLVSLSNSILAELGKVNQECGVYESVCEKLNKLFLNLKSLYTNLNYANYKVDTEDYLSLKDITSGEFLNGLENEILRKGMHSSVSIHSVSIPHNMALDVPKVYKVIINTIRFIKGFLNVRSLPVEKVFIFFDKITLCYYDNVKNEIIHKLDGLRIVVTTNNRILDKDNTYVIDINKVNIDKLSIFKDYNLVELPLAINEYIIGKCYGLSKSIMDMYQISQIYCLPIDFYNLEADVSALNTNLLIHQEKSLSYNNLEQITPIEAMLLEKIAYKNKAIQAPINLNSIKECLSLIKKWHYGQTRKSGDPVYHHLIETANIAFDYYPEEDVILAALLHDILDDTSMSLSYLKSLFNIKVVDMVNAVNKLHNNGFYIYKIKMFPYEAIRELITKGNAKALCIKLADRLHNMRTIEYRSKFSQRRVAEETLLYFVPMAEAINMNDMVNELIYRSYNILNSY